MGGAESEVREDTTAILLEAAYFDGQTVRKASRDLGLRSEASARYEKALIRHAFCWRLNVQSHSGICRRRSALRHG